MQNTNEKENMEYYVGTVKTTILHTKSRKILEIENRVDPKLWYKRTVKQLQNKCNKLQIECTGDTIFTIISFLMCIGTSDVKTRTILGIVFILFFSLLLLNIDSLNMTNKELKHYRGMEEIADNYFSSFQCLDINSYVYDFLESLDEASLVDFCEKDGAIIFNYIDSSGDYSTREVSVSRIRKNIHIPHTKIIMCKNYLECLVPYKLEEKTSATPDANN